MRTFALVASLLNESLASTSVETRPGTIFKISFPNSTSYFEMTNADHVSSVRTTFNRSMFFVKLTHQAVSSVLDLSINVSTLFFAILNGFVDQPSISGFSSSGEDEGWVSSSILTITMSKFAS